MPKKIILQISMIAVAALFAIPLLRRTKEKQALARKQRPPLAVP